MLQRFTIEYQFGTYSGTEVVTLSEDDDRDPKVVMWARLRKQGKLTLAQAYTSAKIVKHEEIEEDEE
jgi:hypothetical protein